MQRNFRQVSYLCQALAEIMDRQFVGQWLDQPNELLGDLKPVEVIERGRVELLWQVVHGLRAGLPL